MITLSFDDIVNKVRARLDEIGANESEMMDTEEDNKNLNSVIKASIPEAYRFISLYADGGLLEGKDGSSASMSIGADLVGEVALPKDYLRLLNIRLSSWDCGCSVLVAEDSKEYRIAANRWMGGSQYRPVAALSHSSDGRSIKLSKASAETDRLSAFSYIPTLAEDAASVDISEQTANAFVYYVAALALKTFREEISDSYFMIARNLIGLD